MFAVDTMFTKIGHRQKTRDVFANPAGLHLIFILHHKQINTISCVFVISAYTTILKLYYC